MKATTENRAHVSHDEIAQRAREIWEREGRQSGRDQEYWLQAERELLDSRKGTSNAGHSPDTSRAGKNPAPAGRVLHI